MLKQQKIILVDFTYFVHQSIYSLNSMLQRKQELIDTGNIEQAEKMLILPSTYGCMSSLISALTKVGVNEEKGDKVILACDDWHNKGWRKEIEISYKENREETRAKASFVDWTVEYAKQNELIDKIEECLPFFKIMAPMCEADDVISEAVRYFKDNECIIISPDADFQQLLTLDNVKIFSPHPHKSVKKCPYRILDLDRDKEKKKAYKTLMSKVEKEKTDNLITEVLTEEDYDKRLQCISLLTLPKFVSDKIKPFLEEVAITEKEFFYPEAFSLGIQKKLSNLYSQDKIITYQSCYDKKLKESLKKKIKKTKEVNK